MTEDLLSQVFKSVELVTFLKPITLFLVGLYIVFSLVIIRQVGLMTSFLGSNTTPFIKTFSWLHFFTAAGIFVIVLVFI
ncbi:MAG: hypothetical protein A3A61_04045 [Candidatus Woykebacteria bacterium RIFCSPLOWO2_01_FULL_43_14]|uniref:Uncharacterized protein n=2 Tax=Candidatus Woykeibacteriota TaxID=1817899 RepID=A0A1G1WUU3_9BACT|nr:MAG: hypothetical protein A3J50_00455 [Candidatus Woykebacteria bacterium RIFCSPHIGHO2_02_FULL_43_16b]OGY31100.1 MAG: hypothetical protein A3A61_04045 [Candidatus Woykebacteria bacterium RIFCSPLOWO2_01_FULL_43_14]